MRSQADTVASMASARPVLSLVAALALAVGVVVIVITPELLKAPNALAAPSALVVVIGCVAACVGGRPGRITGLAVSGVGLALSALWLWMASDGFGLGAAWVDDMIEAAILVATFAMATACLALSDGSISTPVVAAWIVAVALVVALALAIVAPVLPGRGPLPTPVPDPWSQPPVQRLDNARESAARVRERDVA